MTSVATRQLLKSPLVAAGALAAAALLLWRDILTRPVWFDEAATYDYASLPWGRFWEALHHGDAFYALYYAFMHVWIAAFGSTPLALRMPSLLLALATLWLVFSATRRLAGLAAAALTSTALLLNGTFVLYATEARPYAALIFLSTTLTLVLWRATEEQRVQWWFLYGAIAPFAVYVHFYAAFVIAAHVVYLLATKQFAYAARCTLIGIAVGLVALPMVLLAAHDENSQNTWLARPTFRTLAWTAASFADSRYLWRIEAPLAVAGAILGLRGGLRRPTALLICCTVVPLACIFAIGHFRADYRPAYVLEILVPYVALYSVGILSLRRFAAPAAAVFLALNIVVLSHLSRPSNEDWNTTARLIRQDHAPIIMMPQSVYAPLAYAAPDQIDRVIYPSHFSIEHSELREPLVDNLPARFPADARRIWVIYAPDHVDGRFDHVRNFETALERRYHRISDHPLSMLSVREYERNTETGAGE